MVNRNREKFLQAQVMWGSPSVPMCLIHCKSLTGSTGWTLLLGLALRVVHKISSRFPADVLPSQPLLVVSNVEEAVPIHPTT
jgi:hypothetical protein